MTCRWAAGRAETARVFAANLRWCGRIERLHAGNRCDGETKRALEEGTATLVRDADCHEHLRVHAFDEGRPEVDSSSDEEEEDGWGYDLW